MPSSIRRSGFIYHSAPFPSCHAATLVETPHGILAAFFGGTHERHPDVCIYTALLTESGWSRPRCVADGVEGPDTRHPTWNPVLFRPRRPDGTPAPLMLFYKVGPSPKSWWGMLKTSTDDGQTWSPPSRLPDGLLGPIKNKPVQLPPSARSPMGRIISPTSIEGPDIGWRVYFELSHDLGQTWRKTALVEAPPGVGAIQGSILIHPDGRLQALGRTRDTWLLWTTWSLDSGETWSPLELLDLPNCNSGTDAVTLADGRHLLVYNHSNVNKIRWPLNLAVSDDGLHWQAAALFDTEPTGQYSYPAMIQASDGLVHVAYTWKRERMKHVSLDPGSLRPIPMVGRTWPDDLTW